MRRAKSPLAITGLEGGRGPRKGVASRSWKRWGNDLLVPAEGPHPCGHLDFSSLRCLWASDFQALR